MKIFCIILILTFLGCSQQRLYQQTQIMMGTYVEVVSPYKEAISLAFKEIRRIESLLSKYDSESEVSYLNREGKAKVSPDTLFIIKRAKEFFQQTDGAFDITVGVLLKLWGFDSHQPAIPSEEETKKILELVGSEKIVLDEKTYTVEFQKQGMLIDLGAIAKGYAVDCAIKKLREKGIKSALINAGGDLYCLGDRGGRPWQIGIRDPKTKTIKKVIKLKDKAVATSGDYENFFIRDNKLYSHIFDPRKGVPVDSQISSVTIVADDCLTADALATSVFVLGKQRGENLVKNFGAEIADIVLRENTY